MKLNNINNSTLFQKRLVANCSVVKNKKPMKCRIYQLDRLSDINYFKKKGRLRYWYGMGMFPYPLCYMDNPQKGLYTIEDKDSQCIGYFSTEDFICRNKSLEKIKSRNLINLYTATAYKNSTCDRDVKYVGETMLSYVAKKAEEDSIDSVIVATIIDTAKGFYETCGLKRGRGYQIPCDYYMERDGMNFLINKNTNRTQKGIEIII